MTRIKYRNLFGTFVLGLIFFSCTTRMDKYFTSKKYIGYGVFYDTTKFSLERRKLIRLDNDMYSRSLIFIDSIRNSGIDTSLIYEIDIPRKSIKSRPYIYIIFVKNRQLFLKQIYSNQSGEMIERRPLKFNDSQIFNNVFLYNYKEIKKGGPTHIEKVVKKPKGFSLRCGSKYVFYSKSTILRTHKDSRKLNKKFCEIEKTIVELSRQNPEVQLSKFLKKNNCKIF